MIILFTPWRKPADLRNEGESWSDRFSRTIFDKNLLKIIDNIHIENECKDARDTYNKNRRQGKVSPLLEGFVVETTNDISSLNVAIENDATLDRFDDKDEDTVSNDSDDEEITRNGAEDELVGIASRAGLFNAQLECKYEQIKGNSSLVNESEKGIMEMQATLMDSMRKDKRPARKADVSE